jgi:putative ubiquitin-RnfH superfamily antitoxin RatB of RatAB toxin-antitoxin module
MANRLEVTVLYALPEQQVEVPLLIDEGADAASAVAQSGLLERFPELREQPLKLGIFGKVIPLDQRLANGDEVTLLRPLANDPKTARRQRAAQQKRR